MYAVAAEGGARGARAPQPFRKGAEPLQKYMSVMSLTFHEQYCFKWYS